MTRSTARTVLAAAAFVLVAAPPALAAPDRTFEFTPEPKPQVQTWASSPNAGVAPTAEVAAAVNCEVRMCDETLVKTTEVSKIKADILGDQPTAVDIDLYIFKSNAAGEAVTELVRVTDFDADETATVTKQPAGFYLIRGDWSAGAGTFAGKVTVTPTPPVSPKKI